MMRLNKRLVGAGFALVAAAALSAATGAAQKRAAPQKLRFEVSFPASAVDAPVTGRVFVMISRVNDREPRLQIGRTGVPFFGRDVEQLKPGQPATIDDSDLGSPLESLAEIPPGDYFVQAVVNVYSEFKRADGHVVWMHDDQWEGQRWNRSPGNLFSDVQKVHVDPKQGGTIKLTAGNVIPPVEIPAGHGVREAIQVPEPLTDEVLGAPGLSWRRGPAAPRVRARNDFVSGQLHPGALLDCPPYGFDEKNDFSKAWLSDNFPRMIAVTFQHPNPYFDDSYAVNSVNVGPYGDAIMNELIPEVEKRFRVIREPYARILSGGSTGGWEAAALQIFHPDFFGAAFSYCPDSVTFTDVEGINIYEDENAFYKMDGWRKVPTANSRRVNGQLVMTSEQRNHFELAQGTKGRSGEQLDIWSAVFGPLGKDGYFEPLFNKRSGEINREVAQYWKEHYDLKYYLEKNWTTVGPKLVDKLYFYTGDVDTYYLNNSTKALELWMKTTQNPHYEGFFMYGNNKPHCWSGPVTSAERLKEMAQLVQRKRPEGATTPWWTY